MIKGNTLMQEQFEKNVHDTAAVVEDWRRSIESYGNQLNTANAALVRTKHDGEIHRAKASTGDPAAIAAVNTARDAQRAAESTIEEIRRALPKAFSQLAEAERLAGNACRALARPHIEALKHECVAAAARIDRRNAENEVDYELRQRVLLELESWAQDDGMVSRHEDRVGLRRCYAAQSPFVRSLAANPTAKFIPLAESDRQFLGLPPAETATTKAA
jgi:hypothetical protein